jgi:signal transduction histidine kinase
MIMGAVLLYYTVRTTVYRQVDRSLIMEKNIIQEQVEMTDSIPDFAAATGHMLEVKLLNDRVKPVQVFKDTSIYDDKSESLLNYRYIYFQGNTPKRQGYIIKILQILDEKEELLKDISFYMFSLFFALLLISILINYLISKKLWNPFYTTVTKASQFDVLSDNPTELPTTNIEEFSKLNEVINQMTRKMREDYINLKEYNENAAHEFQTPLAIIRSKMEMLMQNKSLRKADLEHVKTINEATSRLFKLNNGFLLISKIENQYFQEEKRISLKVVMENYLNNYREIIQIKNLRTELDFTGPAEVQMNEMLADTLISNLLSNAVRYNIENGFIKCFSGPEYISVSNSGLPLEIDTELMFKRFHKGSNNPQSVGLGLPIVKRIADNYRMRLIYTCTENIHEVRVYFPDKQVILH